MAAENIGDAKIYVAFRFHGNFYHSYRGDTPDEMGFGKDIRIIRKIIGILDAFNKSGVPVCGTWDMENYFSLEMIMPRHCPDIIESIRQRVNDGYDEIELMSYNNGLLSASNATEFEAATERSITNSAGSGVKDLFGAYAPVVRPQEMMYTPSFIKMYRHYGVEAMSLYYSAIPFTCFSSFVPLLSVAERFNPIIMTYPGYDGNLVVIPAHNHGDIVDNLSMRKWLKRLRRQQMDMDKPCDLLFLIDFDADDEFWLGLDIPVARRIFSIFRGLEGFVNSIKDLPFVSFTTPYRYLKDHPPVGTITLGQDTADGSFDGYASWAEKWSNHQLWTGIERSRILEMQSHGLSRLLSESVSQNVRDLMAESFENRLKALSTTHFGMASPIMNRARLETGAGLVHASVKNAKDAFDAIKDKYLKDAPADSVFILDYIRGVSTRAVHYRQGSSIALMRLSLNEAPEKGSVLLTDKNGMTVESALLTHGKGGAELLFIEEMGKGSIRDYRIQASENPDDRRRKEGNGVITDGNIMENGRVSLEMNGGAGSVVISAKECGRGGSSHVTSAITYGNKRYEAGAWRITRNEILSGGLFGVMRTEGEIFFESRGTKKVKMEREFIMSRDLPYLYCTVTVEYPRTEMQKFNKGQAQRLQQKWDGNWMEVMPFELSPEFTGTGERPISVWKHNYFDDITSFDLDYSAYSKNRELDSVNNQVTCGWVAVSNGDCGLLLAQSTDVLASMAFCPMRTRREKNETRVYLNPFGSYSGEQYRYPSAYTGLGRKAATTGTASDHLKPYAPSYNGRTLKFSLMMAPYGGGRPDDAVAADATTFAYPYMILSKSNLIGEPAHRNWSMPDFFPGES